MVNEVIEVILTGGRLEKVLNEEIGRLFYTESCFSTMLEQSHCTLDLKKHTLMLKDSLEINQDDLDAIAACCAHTPGKKVLISHGINTIIRTALDLAARKIPKTIVLYGAFLPFSLSRSDALFHFGSALTAVQMLPHGVYVAMNGRIIPADKVRRDPETGNFYEQ